MKLTEEQLRREELKRRELIKTRRFATALLFLMVLIFLVSLFWVDTYSWLRFVRAFSEAAMIGALADWFAVTALFRHPFGIPIPHTAIIPNNKDRIGQSLGNFVQNNFLTPEIVAAKLEAVGIAQNAADWLSDPERSAAIADNIAAAIPEIVQALNDEDVHNFIETNITERIRALEAAPLLGQVLTVLTTHNKHQRLFDEGLRIAAQALENNKDLIRTRIAEESPWFVPEFVDKKVYERIIARAEDVMNDVRRDPEHELRRKFHSSTQEFVEKLKQSPEYRARGEAMKEEFLQHPVVRQYVHQVWGDIKTMLLRDVADPDSTIRKRLRESVRKFGEGLLNDPAMQAKIDEWVRSAVVQLASQRRAAIGELIADTVRKWDGDTLAHKMEIQVGRDLQFVRINGTIVGGIVGLLIYALSLLAD